MKSNCTSISIRTTTFQPVSALRSSSLWHLWAQWPRTRRQVGTLSCDVSAGLGLFVVEKQKLTCMFTQDSGTENYTGTIDQFGVELGGVESGHLIWGVLAATKGLPMGALDGSYVGVGANASLGAGAGANVLVGGSERTLSLQPISVEGQVGVNIAGGVTTVKLMHAP